MASVWVQRQKAFFVPGKPVTKGNIAISPHTGRGYHREGDRLKDWSESIAWAVRFELSKGLWLLPHRPGDLRFNLPATMFPWQRDGVQLGTSFIMRRPRNRRGRDCDVKPDGDKLHRAVGDALTGILYRDDAQIVAGSYRKWYQDEFSPEQPEGVAIQFSFHWDEDELVSYLRRTDQAGGAEALLA